MLRVCSCTSEVYCCSCTQNAYNVCVVWFFSSWKLHAHHASMQFKVFNCCSIPKIVQQYANRCFASWLLGFDEVCQCLHSHCVKFECSLELRHRHKQKFTQYNIDSTPKMYGKCGANMLGAAEFKSMTEPITNSKQCFRFRRLFSMYHWLVDYHWYKKQINGGLWWNECLVHLRSIIVLGVFDVWISCQKQHVSFYISLAER